MVAVERRLGDAGAGQLQDLAGLAQLANLALQSLDALLLGIRRAGPHAAVGFPSLCHFCSSNWHN